MLIEEDASGLQEARSIVVTSVPSAGIQTGFARLVRPLRFAGFVGLLAIIALSLVPAEWRPSTGLAKELEHGIAYCLVAVVLTLAGLARWPQILSIVVLAAALELGQRLVPGRDSSLTDFLLSASGALVGFGLCSLVPGLISRDYAWYRLGDPGPFRSKAIAAIVAVGVLAVGVSIAAAPGTGGWLGAGLAIVMLAIAVVDGQHFVIPDPLNAAGLALGFASSAVSGQGDLVAAMAGSGLRAAVLALSFLALRLTYVRLRGRGGIGLGDVKLAAVAGAWLDWPVMPIAVEIAALSAISVYALRRYLLRHPLWSGSRLPFGLYFAPAIWIGWLLHTTLMQGW